MAKKKEQFIKEMKDCIENLLNNDQEIHIRCSEELFTAIIYDETGKLIFGQERTRKINYQNPEGKALTLKNENFK